MRSAVKRANKTDKPIFLCMLKAKKLPAAKTKRGPIKAIVKGQDHGEKRKIKKEMGPGKEELSRKDHCEEPVPTPQSGGIDGPSTRGQVLHEVGSVFRKSPNQGEGSRHPQDSLRVKIWFI